MLLPFLRLVYHTKYTAATIDAVEFGLTLWKLVSTIDVVEFRTCLQQNDLIFFRHGEPTVREHLPGFSFCICLFWHLFFSILLLPFNSLRFLSHLNAVIGWQLSIAFRDSFITSNSSVFQSFYWCLDRSECKFLI